MLIFLNTSRFFEKNIVNLFMLATLSVLLLTVVDSIEYWTASFTYKTMLRVWMSAIGYSIWPIVVYLIILMVGRKQLGHRTILAVPLLMNAMVSFSALFCGAAYFYSDERV